LLEVRNLMQYVEMSGMYFLEDANKLGIYNSINDDIFTFKKYDIQSSLKVNSHGLVEVPLDTADVTLLGSANLPGQLQEVRSTIHIVSNNLRLKKDAYLSCQKVE